MLGQRTLFVNPPLINGIAFTRQGRCQEREEVLGTTKPPYSLALLAALFRARSYEVRLVDLTAERLSTDALLERLARERFTPTLIVFGSTTPTLDADVAEMVTLKRAFGAPLVCFGPHASCAPQESMGRAPDVDVMIVGEPEDACLAIASAGSLDQASAVPGTTTRLGGAVTPHTDRGGYHTFLQMPYPAWDLLPLGQYTLPLANKRYVIVETSRGCPYTCDFCVAPIHQGHKFRERDAKSLVDEIERGYRDFGIEYFYLWGDTVTLNVNSFGRFCDELIARNLPVHWFGNARADNLVNVEFVKRLKQSGCWMLSLGIESASDDLRQDMMKKLERQKIQTAFRNMRQAGIKSFAFFILGYPGETLDTIEQTTQYALALDPDFANFYPAVPYPGTDLYEKCRREGLLATRSRDDWSKLEYSYYVLSGNGLDEDVVMAAINRAKRRFFLRPRYLARHFGEIARIAVTHRATVSEILSRIVFGRRVHHATRRPAEHATPGSPTPKTAS